MSYVTVSCLTLFIITLNGFIQSAPMGQNILAAINREGMFINKEIMNDIDIIYGDVMRSKSKNLPVSADAARDAELWNPDEPIPIYASRELTQNVIDSIEVALNDIQNHTCLRFKNAEESDMESGVIAYQDGDSCSSFIGKQGGVQPVIMHSYCGCPGLAVHETMHALGFVHEHQRSDRDRYVRILFNNIRYGYEDDFEIIRTKDSIILATYDYDSIMHYPSYAFSDRSDLNTIEPKERGVVLIGTCETANYQSWTWSS